MSSESNSPNRGRKRDRFLGLFKGLSPQSSSSAVQSRSDGTNADRPPVVPESVVYIHDCRQISYTSTINNGPVNIVKHIENATINLSDGGSEALLWNNLPKQRDTSAQHNDYLEGSREGDVETILRWIDHGPLGELVLWVQGPAGIGKSTLARHLRHLLRGDDRLAASVFLGAIPSDARGPESVIKIIAREIGTIHPVTIPVILSAISVCHGAPPQEQVEKLVLAPIRSLQRSSSLIIILDAIDEWEHYELLVKELEWIAPSSPALKLILLGRPDPRTRGLQGTWLSTYRLEPVSNFTMQRYFTREFETVKWDLGWAPSENQIVKLVELANGLFIWAKVVCSLLKKRFGLSTPRKTLEAILYSSQSVGAELGLAHLYHQAIVWLFTGSDDQELLRRYLGAALALQEPLPADVFSSLARLPTHIVESIKMELAALQIRHPVGDIQLIHPANMLFHLSFLEYLQSLSTPASVSFHISVFESHSQLAESCLLELRDFLPRVQHSSSGNLSPRQKYTVKYMPVHIQHGTPYVESESDDDWTRTPHCSLLQAIKMPAFIQWGRLFVALARPGYPLKRTKNPGLSRGESMMDVAARLEGDLVALPARISCLEVAVRLDPHNPDCWCQLGWAYFSLAKSTHSRDTCDQAVRAQRKALEVDGSTGETNDGRLLYSLGTVLYQHYEHFGNRKDLSEAITLLRKALSLHPPGHSGRDSSLNNLAEALSKTGFPGDLQESIALFREALECRPPGHPSRGNSINNLANALLDTGSSGDLQKSIALYREALECRPPGHPDRARSLYNLANTLSHKVSLAGGLQESIALYREALGACPPGHPNNGRFLNNLASTLSMTGSPGDLQESIALHREALQLHPPGHPGHSRSLRNLAYSLSKTGSIEDQEESIRLRREAQNLLPAQEA